ncbi:MAG TPA: hypothetical protein VGM39_09580 [Kofleriaceae bacterium]|jgi:hypothetical protein
MRFVLASLLALPLFAACDPMLPAAQGTVSITPGVDARPYTALELRWEEANDHPASGESQRIEAPELPMDFFIGGGIGQTDASHYRLRAWLTAAPATAPETTPSAGAPYFDQDLDVHCSGSCDVVENVEIQLEP